MRCENCPLQDSPCSSSVGSKKAKIAIVGRNPGRVEAMTGVPFTGPSGELLDATLAEVGLNRDDLYIANAVNCHWPEDSGPPPEAYAACKPRLVAELAEVKPELIMTLGNEGTQQLLGKKVGGITSLIGTMHSYFGAWILPTYHPAYILRGNIDGFDDFEEAFHRAKALVNGERPFPQPLPFDKVHYSKTEKEVYHNISYVEEHAGKVLAIDTETDFVRDPTHKILLLQLSDGKDAWVFEAEYLLHGPAFWTFQKMLDDPSRTWIFHNAAFDLQQLYHHWHVMPEHIEDSMALALCLSEKLQHCGLKRLVNTYLSVPHYEEGIHKYLTHKGVGFSAIPRAELVPYAGFDAIFTYRLWPILRDKVEAAGNYRLYPLLVELQRLFAQMQYHGVEVDLSVVEELRAEYEPLLDRLEKEMQAYAWGKGFKATEVVANAKDWPFLNVKSPKQLNYFLNQYCGYKTDTTNKKFMALHEGDEFIDMLFRYRKVEHLMSTYVEGIAREVWPDGRVHPDFSHGAVTGRVTIQNPPMQTIPSDDWAEQFNVQPVRKLFVAAKGCKIVHADYSQLEIRVGWYITGDEELGKAVMTKDMHRTMASLVYRKPPEEITAYERSNSKLVTFGMLYGRQAPSLAKQMKISIEEAKGFLKSFSERFPKYFGWWEGQQSKALETGVLETEYGRRRRWSLITPDNALEIQRQAVNFPIQSTASDICLDALIKINRELIQRGWGRALFSIHDSVELEVKDEHIEEAKVLIEDIMTHPFADARGVIFKIKMGVGRDLNEASRE